MPRISLARQTSKDDTETIITDLVNQGQIDERKLKILPDHFEGRASSLSYHYCGLCGLTLKPGQKLENHLSAKRGHNLDLKGTVALALTNFSKGVLEKIKGANVNLDLIPDPETEGEQRIHRAYMKQLRMLGIPISGAEKGDVPSTGSLKKTLTTLVRTLRKEERDEGMEGGHPQIDRPGSHSPYSLESDIEERPLSLSTHDPSNVIRRELTIQSIDDTIYTAGQTVSKVFEKQVKLELLFHHQDDDIDPTRYTVDFVPQERTIGWIYQVKTSLQLWRKLKSNDHPLLKQYENYVKEIQKKHGNETNTTAGIGAYPSYCARFALVAMRARARLGETLSVDDILYSCTFVNAFFNRLKIEGVSSSVRMNFMKALRHAFKWIEQFLNPVWLAGKRGAISSTMKNRLRYILTELKVEDKKESSILNVAKEDTKKPVLYCVARAVVCHPAVQKEVDRIMKKVRVQQEEVTHAEFNFVLGTLCLWITVFNTTRNEAIYKSINASFNTSRNNLGKEIQGTGLLELVDGDEKYWVGCYPNPKQARGMRTRSSVLGGLIVFDGRMHALLKSYEILRQHRAVRMKAEPKLLDPRGQYFLSYDCKPIDMYTTPWLMKTVLRLMNIEEEISCNVMRHATANLQFDEYVAKELSGGAHKEVAYLAGHETATQLRWYTDDHKKIALAGFKKLSQLAADELAKNDAVVQTAMKSVQLTKNLKSMENTIDEQEKENDERYQLIRDLEPSDYEEDHEIENAGVNKEAITKTSVERIRAPKPKRRIHLRARKDVSYREKEQGIDNDSSSTSVENTSEDFLPRKKTSARAPEEPQYEGESSEQDQIGIEDTGYIDLMNELSLGRVDAIHEDEDTIMQAINQHNNSVSHDLPRMTMVGDDLVDFKKRRYNRPVQRFSWVAIRKRQDGQFGLFAKKDISKGAITLDYRGRTILAADHHEKIKNVSAREASKIADYYFEHKIEHRGKTVNFGIEAHHTVYDGTVVLGRFLNHSLCCSNLTPRFHKEFHGNKLEVYVYFKANRNIKKNEELLWNYGTHYDEMPWYYNCLCKPTVPTAAEASGPIEFTTESPAELEARGPSMSQSAVAAPFQLLTRHAETSSLADLVYSSTSYKQLFLRSNVPGEADCMIALHSSQESFGEPGILPEATALLKPSDIHRILTIMVRQLDQKKSGVLVLKPAGGFTGAVAIVIGNFDLSMFLIYREKPRQYITLSSRPNRRGDQPFEQLMGDVRFVRPTLNTIQDLLEDKQIDLDQVINALKNC